MADVDFNSLNYRWGLCVKSEDSCVCHFIPLSTNVPSCQGSLPPNQTLMKQITALELLITSAF